MREGWDERLDRPASVHFVGIGGVGMAGLARLLLQRGFRVSGSDAAPNRLCDDLASMGARIFRGHGVGHVPPDTAWAVRTPAVAGDNPEVVAARARGVPVFNRGEVLASFSGTRDTIAVAGAHGKTTTSAMLAHMLRACGVDCGYAIGGETALPGRVADAGDGNWLVCEADESDGSLALYAPKVAVLTHVEWDHVERFASEEALLRCYRRFVAHSDTVWVREDDPLAIRLAEGAPRVRKAGSSSGCAAWVLNAEDDPRGQRVRVVAEGRELSGRLALPGRHNSWNAVLALGAAMEAGVDAAEAWASMADFQSVGRRFQRLEVKGVTLIHDYAHHPTEIRAVIASARALRPRRLLVVFQPHRYSRTRHLLRAFAESFRGADRLDLLPVYAASEVPDQGVDSAALLEACADLKARLWPDRASLAEALVSECREGDVVLIAGAGDVERLQGELGRML